MESIYAVEARRVGQLAFSMWNRDPASPSFGSFDRPYWGWKYKDFSDATMQYAARLAVEYGLSVQGGAALESLLEAYAHYCARIQHRDGSFDQCYPFEKSPGVLYDFLSTLVYVRTSPLLKTAAARSALDGAMERGVAFLLRTDEKHGSVANHIAQYAWELFNYAHYSGDPAAGARARQYLERVLSWFVAQEGWFLEYHGADPGYQTRTLRYLAKIAQLNEDASLWDTISRAARFVEETLMPDGSVHPMLGCRATALLYPSSFELLAGRDPRFVSLAQRVRAAWSSNRVPWPSQIDFGNAIRLGDDALDAAGAPTAAHAATTAQPAHDAHFPQAGLLVRRRPQRAAYVSSDLGGAIVLYTRDPDRRWQLAYEDSGYLLRLANGRESWVVHTPGCGRLIESNSDRIVVEAAFHRSLHDELTPLRLLLLRALNLSALRFQWVADRFRQLVVRKLMSGFARRPLMLRREIELREDHVLIRDRIVATRRLDGHLYRCRRITGLHMASSRYFQTQELGNQPWMERIAWTGDSVDVPVVRIGLPAEAGGIEALQPHARALPDGPGC